MQEQSINPRKVSKQNICRGFQYTGRVLDSNNVVLAMCGGNRMFDVQEQMRKEASSLESQHEIGYIQTIDNTTLQILLSQKGLSPDASVAIG